MFLIQTHFQPLPHTAFCFSGLPSSLICVTFPGAGITSPLNQVQIPPAFKASSNYTSVKPLLKIISFLLRFQMPREKLFWLHMLMMCLYSKLPRPATTHLLACTHFLSYSFIDRKSEVNHVAKTEVSAGPCSFLQEPLFLLIWVLAGCISTQL